MDFDKLIENVTGGIGMLRINAAVELGKKKDKRAVPHLIKALTDTNDGVRSNAAFALGEIGSPEATPHLKNILNDNVDRVRKSACKALGLLKATETIPELITVLQKDEDYNVRRCAARSLGQIGSSKAIEALQVATEDSEFFVANMAKDALKKLQAG